MKKQNNNLERFYRIIEIGALLYGTTQNNKIALTIGFIAMFVTEVLLKKWT